MKQVDVVDSLISHLGQSVWLYCSNKEKSQKCKVCPYPTLPIPKVTHVLGHGDDDCSYTDGCDGNNEANVIVFCKHSFNCVCLILILQTALTSLDGLTKFIDLDQLISDLGGSFKYDHSKWLNMRMVS